jgi:hypothetical protein
MAIFSCLKNLLSLENNHSTLTTEGMAVDEVASGGQIVFALGTVRDCRIEAGPTA